MYENKNIRQAVENALFDFVDNVNSLLPNYRPMLALNIMDREECVTETEDGKFVANILPDFDDLGFSEMVTFDGTLDDFVDRYELVKTNAISEEDRDGQISAMRFVLDNNSEEWKWAIASMASIVEQVNDLGVFEDWVACAAQGFAPTDDWDETLSKAANRLVAAAVNSERVRIAMPDKEMLEASGYPTPEKYFISLYYSQLWTLLLKAANSLIANESSYKRLMHVDPCIGTFVLALQAADMHWNHNDGGMSFGTY